MVLRFMSASSVPEYIAFNSELRVYTTDAEQVKRGEVIRVACNYFDHIRREIDFNCYSFSRDLSPVDELEDVPLF